VRYTLDDSTEVWFEAAESSLVQGHSADPEVHDGGRLGGRLRGIAEAAEQIARELRAGLTPDEISLEFGLKVSGEVNWWFFAKAQSEGAIKVTLKWAGDRDSGEQVEDDDRIVPNATENLAEEA